MNHYSKIYVAPNHIYCLLHKVDYLYLRNFVIMNIDFYILHVRKLTVYHTLLKNGVNEKYFLNDNCILHINHKTTYCAYLRKCHSKAHSYADFTHCIQKKNQIPYNFIHRLTEKQRSKIIPNLQYLQDIIQTIIQNETYISQLFQQWKRISINQLGI